MNLKEQVVLDNRGKPIAVQIPMKLYKKLLKIIEDIKAYDNAMKRKQEFISFEEAITVLRSV